jgi:DNA-binding NarL/FixJ family response regulator
MYMNQIRVLLISPNLLLRESIMGNIKSCPDLAALGLAEEKTTIMQKASQFKPHVLLLDANLNFALCKFLVKTAPKEFPGTKFAIFGVAPGDTTLLEFVKAGVAGFIIRDAPFNILTETIRLVAQGFAILPPSLNAALFHQIERHAVVDGGIKVNDSVRISRREQEIINLVKEGMSNKEIADMLVISTFTVKNHIHRILEKLSLRSRTQIAAGLKELEPSNVV